MKPRESRRGSCWRIGDCRGRNLGKPLASLGPHFWRFGRDNKNTQVVKAIERKEEIALLSASPSKVSPKPTANHRSSDSPSQAQPARVSSSTALDAKLWGEWRGRGSDRNWRGMPSPLRSRSSSSSVTATLVFRPQWIRTECSLGNTRGRYGGCRHRNPQRRLNRSDVKNAGLPQGPDHQLLHLADPSAPFLTPR